MQFNETGQADPAGNPPPLPPRPAEKVKPGRMLLISGIVTAAALAWAGWWAWRQWTAVKEISESAQRISSAIETGLAASARSGFPGAVPSVTSAPVYQSGLSMLPTLPGGLSGLPRAAPEMARNAEKMMKALSRYSDRPLVKEFLAEINSDPGLRKVLQKGASADPLGMISRLQNAVTFTKIIEKYSKRPEFIPLIMEVMLDPEIKPLLQSMGPVLPGGMGVMSMPARLPEQGQLTVPPIEPAPAPYDSRSMTLDPSSIQGNGAVSGTPVRKKEVPLPGQ